MDAAEERLRALAAHVQEKRDDLKRSAAEHRRKLKALDDLELAIKGAPASFDREDVDAVADARRDHEEALQRLIKADAEQERLRESTEKLLREMGNCLDTRTELLERQDGTSGVLREHPDLCRSFARKQVALQNLIEGRLQEMLTRFGGD